MRKLLKNVKQKEKEIEEENNKSESFGQSQEKKEGALNNLAYHSIRYTNLPEIKEISTMNQPITSSNKYVISKRKNEPSNEIVKNSRNISYAISNLKPSEPIEKTCEINNNINKNNSQYNSYSSLSYKRKKNLNKEEHNENIIKEDIKNENKRKDFKEKTIKYTKINKDCIRFAKNLSIKSQNDTINNINNHSNNFPNSESESNSLELSINSLSGELSCCPNEIRIRYDNKNKCRIIYNENEYELKNKLNIENDKKNKILQITLKIIINITNMEKMFYSYYPHRIPLISVDFSNFDSSNVTNMNSMFSVAHY